MKTTTWIAAVAVAVGLTASPRVEAAPQILAALPMESGIELKCDKGLCVAELSTYCLQRERPAPTYGTAYVPAAPEHFTLVLQSDNGKEVRVPAGQHMQFVENRGFMSVAATIELGRMVALGAQDAKLVVWEGASLIPVPEPNDPNPLTDEEIAFVTDSLRDFGQSIVDARPQADTARLLAKLTNKLPEHGTLPRPELDSLWKEAIGEEIIPMDGPAMTGAEEAIEDCQYKSSTYAIGGMKRCLEIKHDDFIRELNIEYWDNQPSS